MNIAQCDIRFTTKTPPHNEVRGSLFSMLGMVISYRVQVPNEP